MIMTDRKIYVYVDLDGELYQVGQLWTHSSRAKEGASFQYEKKWLTHHERFSLEPALALTEGSYHTGTGRSMFGAMGDSAPDRWGRILMRRAAAHLARASDGQLRTLTEIDYLLGVYDEARQGALRFSENIGGPFLQQTDGSPIPPLVELPKLLAATENLLEDKESDEDMRLLLAPGSSLGGARPKASVRDRDGQLAIAKFPCKDDDYSTVLWEALALTIAAKAGLTIPQWRLESVAKKPTLIIKRFDRHFVKRVPFLSAMSMIGAKDNEQHSYLELVDALRQYGASPVQDMIDLWKRIVFSILISNTDDHLRNHGFLYERYKGWRLSPLYDVNPTPVEIKPRVLTTTIDFYDGTASLDLALSVAKEFGLTQEEAKKIAKQVGGAVLNWREEASHLGISATEIDRMASAFDHQDIVQATQF